MDEADRILNMDFEEEVCSCAFVFTKLKLKIGKRSDNRKDKVMEIRF